MQMVQDLKPKQLKLKFACLDLGQCTIINQKIGKKGITMKK